MCETYVDLYMYTYTLFTGMCLQADMCTCMSACLLDLAACLKTSMSEKGSNLPLQKSHP